MHETSDDLAELQRLLDESYESAGVHLRRIITLERRVSAARLCDLLRGVQVLSLATVTAGGEPRVAPVDGLFFRGRFWFGSSPDSYRFRHIRRRPAVSASHTRGEDLAVTVHGVAMTVDTSAPDQADFREYCLEVYGDDWLSGWGVKAQYARIDATQMFTLAL